MLIVNNAAALKSSTFFFFFLLAQAAVVLNNSCVPALDTFYIVLAAWLVSLGARSLEESSVALSARY